MQESRASGSGNSANSGHKSQKRIYGSELGSPNAHGFNFFSPSSNLFRPAQGQTVGVTATGNPINHENLSAFGSANG